ncbi:EF-hand calcium-binding domain-containing protein 4A [Nymphon striatum]|nr:EF-hand calcium-binding domain-containing protein 4A [Nymphon striatum]
MAPRVKNTRCGSCRQRKLRQMRNDDVKNMWSGMRRENPRLLTSFEEFLGRVNREMKQNKVEYANLEEAYKTKSNMHEHHIKNLYEEMEVQIGNEKDRLLADRSDTALNIEEIEKFF